MRQQLAQYDARFAVRREFEWRAEDITLLADEVYFKIALVRLAISPIQLWLRIEQINMAGATVLEQADDGIGRRQEVRKSIDGTVHTGCRRSANVRLI